MRCARDRSSGPPCVQVASRPRRPPAAPRCRAGAGSGCTPRGPRSGRAAAPPPARAAASQRSACAADRSGAGSVPSTRTSADAPSPGAASAGASGRAWPEPHEVGVGVEHHHAQGRAEQRLAQDDPERVRLRRARSARTGTCAGRSPAPAAGRAPPRRPASRSRCADPPGGTAGGPRGAPPWPGPSMPNRRAGVDRASARRPHPARR